MTDNTEDKVVIKPDLENFETVKSHSGKKSKIRKDDPVAAGMAGMSLEQVYQVADDLGITVDKKHYSNLNPGMQRMCIGNKVRGWINKTTKENEVKVAKSEKPGPDPMVSFNKVCKPIQDANAKAAKEAEAKAKAADKEKADKAEAKAKATKDANAAKTKKGKAA